MCVCVFFIGFCVLVGVVKLKCSVVFLIVVAVFFFLGVSCTCSNTHHSGTHSGLFVVVGVVVLGFCFIGEFCRNLQ